MWVGETALPPTAALGQNWKHELFSWPPSTGCGDGVVGGFADLLTSQEN